MVSDRETPQKAPAQRTAKSHGGDPEMGEALRSVYQQTIEEQIPPEMLDLLGKLE